MKRNYRVEIIKRAGEIGQAVGEAVGPALIPEAGPAASTIGGMVGDKVGDSFGKKEVKIPCPICEGDYDTCPCDPMEQLTASNEQREERSK
jgi:hypothetical protein